jgi:CheY-like chemotaxis protein
MQASANSPGRVLVIDDDPEAALFATYALEKGGFTVTRTPDPAMALALVAAEPWNLALTDLDLPGISGAELIAALRLVAPRLPVIVLTAHPRAEFPEGDAAPDGLLLKPVSAQRLLAAAVALTGGGAGAGTP